MKKIITISTLLLVSLAITSFAANLDSLTPDIVNLSNSVQGDYFSNGAATDDSTHFSMSTGHEQGGFVYATGSFTTDIYRKASSEPFVTGDLLGTPSVYNTAAFDGWTGI